MNHKLTANSITVNTKGAYFILLFRILFDLNILATKVTKSKPNIIQNSAMIILNTITIIAIVTILITIGI